MPLTTVLHDVGDITHRQHDRIGNMIATALQYTARIKEFKSAARQWYDGRYVLSANDRNSNVFLIGGRLERHWTANILHTVIALFRKHRIWLVGILSQAILKNNI